MYAVVPDGVTQVHAAQTGVEETCEDEDVGFVHPANASLPFSWSRHSRLRAGCLGLAAFGALVAIVGTGLRSDLASRRDGMSSSHLQDEQQAWDLANSLSKMADDVGGAIDQASAGGTANVTRLATSANHMLDAAEKDAQAEISGITKSMSDLASSTGKSLGEGLPPTLINVTPNLSVTKPFGDVGGDLHNSLQDIAQVAIANLSSAAQLAADAAVNGIDAAGSIVNSNVGEVEKQMPDWVNETKAFVRGMDSTVLKQMPDLVNESSAMIGQIGHPAAFMRQIDHDACKLLAKVVAAGKDLFSRGLCSTVTKDSACQHDLLGKACGKHLSDQLSSALTGGAGNQRKTKMARTIHHRRLNEVVTEAISKSASLLSRSVVLDLQSCLPRDLVLNAQDGKPEHVKALHEEVSKKVKTSFDKQLASMCPA